VSHGSRPLALIDLNVRFIDVRLPELTLMAEYLFTNCFLNEVLRKRPYINQNGASLSSRTPSISSLRKPMLAVFGRNSRT
jgi:hypothetical protein